MGVSPADRSLILGRIHPAEYITNADPAGQHCLRPERKSEIEGGRKKRPFLPSSVRRLLRCACAREVCVGTYENRTSERTETNLEAISAAVVFARQSGVVLAMLI